MNPQLCRIALRPRGPAEVFDLTWRLMRERIRPLLRLTALVLVPIWLVATAACWAFDGHWAILLPVLLLGVVAQAPFTVAGGRLLFAEDTGAWAALRDTVVMAPRVFWVLAVTAFAWLLASLTCFLALPWAHGGLIYTYEAALLERVGPSRGLRRTGHLASRHLGNAGSATFAAAALLLWFGLLGEAVGQAVVGFVLQLGQPFGSLTDGAVTPWLIGGMLLAQPIVALYRLLLYVDVRTRVEGWDLQVGLRAAGLAS